MFITFFTIDKSDEELEGVRAALQKTHLPKMSLEDLIMIVKPTGFFDDHTILTLIEEQVNEKEARLKQGLVFVYPEKQK